MQAGGAVLEPIFAGLQEWVIILKRLLQILRRTLIILS